MTDSRFRNRVVGALVLVSLAVIFIPMILTGQGSIDVGYRGPAIPPEPDFKFPDKIIDKPVTAPLVPAAPRVTVVESGATDEKVESGTTDEKEAEAARGAALAKPEVSIQEPTPEVAPTKPDEVAASTRAAPAWSVQVGSFANKTSAFTLRDQLRAKKFAAYVESVPTASGPIYRVRVGPELQQALAETLQARIAKESGHKGIVVSHR